MLNEKSSKPYYRQIKDYILYRINNGELSAHDRLPSERNLSEQFGVSRLTVTRALKDLVRDGRLYTRVGKGTFVSETPIAQTLDILTGFSDEMQKRGQRASSQVLDQRIIPATDTLSRRLQIPAGVDVVCLKRIRIAGTQPMALETAYLIASLCQMILEQFDFSHDSLYRVLQMHYGLNLTHAEQEIEARMATGEEAHHLKLEMPAPVLSMTRVTCDESERPVEYVESVYRGDRYKFRARLVTG